MSAVFAPVEANTIRQEAAARAVGYHRWSDLLFVHWQVPPESVAPLLPRALALDTWDGAAWLGLVPFRMSGVRPRWSPAVPGVSAFPETNVRTYVRGPDGEPAVWFFSLDAARRLAVLIGRWRWNLNYHFAAMRVRRQGARVLYTEPPPLAAAAAHSDIEAEIGAPLIWHAADGKESNFAPPGTLEHFLVERYLFYNIAPGGRLLCGRVRHTPYPLHAVRLVRLEESLLAASGLRPESGPCHTLFSNGVAVDVLPLVLS